MSSHLPTLEGCTAGLAEQLAEKFFDPGASLLNLNCNIIHVISIGFIDQWPLSTQITTWFI